jgi:hypothetical protein
LLRCLGFFGQALGIATVIVNVNAWTDISYVLLVKISLPLLRYDVLVTTIIIKPILLAAGF